MLLRGGTALLLKGGVKTGLHRIGGSYLNHTGALFVLDRPLRIRVQRGFIVKHCLKCSERHHRGAIARHTALIYGVQVRSQQLRRHDVVVRRVVLAVIVEMPIKIV